MNKRELQTIIKEELRKVLSEAYVPNNIAKFAKEKGVASLVKKVAGWAEKSGKKIVGGTAIGKNYSTLILDLTYHGGEIYINTDEERVDVHGQTVTDYKSFVKALSVDEAINEDTTFPIGVTGVEAQGDKLIITIGNNSADLYGYKPKPAELKKLNAIMQNLFMAKPIKLSSKGEFDEGVLAYEVGRRITIKDILDAVKAVAALKMTHTY